ncbi:hypothetical protein O9992_14315 [Vibrio lentus]|nr:hypothetical protein [Vibrio lentus]
MTVAGMDPDGFVNCAVKRGLMDEDAASRLSNKECLQSYFCTLASRSKETNLRYLWPWCRYGRCESSDQYAQMARSISILKWDKAPRLRSRVPLTLAILPTLMVDLRATHSHCHWLL